MNKLWIIIKSLKLGRNSEKARFYLNGGEIFKLGRVVMKVIEVNTDILPSHSASEAAGNSRETNTEMSQNEDPDDQLEVDFNVNLQQPNDVGVPFFPVHQPEADEEEIKNNQDEEDAD